MTRPFTYCITHKATKKRYYGVRYKKGCHPNELGVKYFGSSKYLLSLIAEQGKDNFEFEIRREFVNSKQACLWEHKVLRRLDAMNSPYWFNLSNGSGRSSSEAVAASNKSRIVTDQERLNRANASRGRRHSEETKAKLSAAFKGRRFSAETIERMKSSHWSNKLDKAPEYVPKRSIESRARTSAKLKGKAIGKKHYNDGTRNYCVLPHLADSAWIPGRINVKARFRRH